jgi:hypothetical protein
MNKSLLALLLALSGVFFAHAQTIGDYRSVGDGDWDDISIWEVYDGVSFIAATSFPEATTANVITIRTPNAVSIAAGSDGISIDQLVVQTGGAFNVLGFSIIIENGAGVDLNNSGTISADPAAISFAQDAVYEHSQNGGSLPIADWGVGSECRITGVTTTAPSDLGQNFYHFIWSSNQSANINLNGALTEVILGNLTVSNTGAANERLRFFSDGGSGEVLNIIGDLIISGGSSVVFTNTATDCQVVVGGNFSNSSSRRQTFALGAGGSVIVDVTGNLSHSTNGLRLTANATASATLNLFGNFSLAGTTLSSTAGSSAVINFRSGTVQTFTRTGTPTQTGPLAWNVLDNTTLDIAAASFLAGTTTTSSFFLESGSTLVTRAVNGSGTNASGAIQSSTTQGSIRVATTLRTYQTGSTITYQGAAAQQMGNGHPAAANTVINNSVGVTTVGSRSILGDLTLQSGNLTIAGTTALTLGGVITAGANAIVPTTTSDIVLLGNGLTGVFPFPAGAITFRNFTLDRISGSVTFNNNVTLTGVVSLANGELDFSGRALILNGTFSAPAGSLLSTSNTSVLQIGGTGAFGSLVMSSSPGNVVGTFTFNRTTGGTLTNASDFFVANIFNLNNGTLTNSSRIVMANNANLLRTASTATLVTNGPEVAVTGETYNVTYSNTLTTGLELPDASNSTDMGNLTVSGGTVTLSQDLTINGSVSLNGGTLAQGANTITMEGGFWNDNIGNITSTTGTVVFNSSAGTTVGGSSTPQFGNLTLNNGAMLTLPSIVNISGNILINSGGTLNAATTTIVLNGAVSSNFGGGGKTYFNLSQSKTGGADVTLTSGVNLTGVLTVVNNGSDFASGGLLTLVSNASGTATIAELLTGRTVSGNVNAQRFVAGVGRFYRDISTPVTNPSVQQIISSGVTITGNFTGSSFPCGGCATNNPSMFFYTESVAGAQNQGYTAFPTPGGNSSTSFLTTGRGYNVLVRNEIGSPTITLTGTINSGSINLPVSFTSTAGGITEDGWNFVGNPYPSAIDWDAAGWTKTNVAGNQISVYDPTKPPSGGYRVWNGAIGDLGNGRIASGQGFWFKADAAPTLTVTESTKSSTATSFYRTRESNEELDYLRIDLTGLQTDESAFIQRIDQASHGYDTFDGNKLSPPDQVSFSTLSSDKRKLSINSIGVVRENDEFQLKLVNLIPGEYSLSISELVGDFLGKRIKIRDNFLKTETDMSLLHAFKFSVRDMAGSTNPDRFTLVFGDGLSSLNADLRIAQVYPNPVQDIIYSEVFSETEPISEIVDMNGKSMGSLIWENIEKDLWLGKADMTWLPSGVYLLKLTSEKGFEFSKIIKK